MRFLIKSLNIKSAFKNKELINKLSRLAFSKSDGMLRDRIDTIKSAVAIDAKVDGRVIYAIFNKEIIGWGLLLDDRRKRWSEDGTSIMLYVKAVFRRKGVGSAILEKAKKISKSKFKIFPHDTKSNKFFSKNLDRKKMRIEWDFPLEPII